MRILAIFLPPVAVLLCGKPIQALINLVLTCCLWLPGAIHAFIVVGDRNADKRTDRLVEAMKETEKSTSESQS